MDVNSVAHGAKQAIASAARRVQLQWSPRERRQREALADVMQLRLLALLGWRPALVFDRKGAM